MKNSTAFWASREVLKRAEAASSDHSTEVNDHVRNATVTYASHGWSRKSSGIDARRCVRLASHASASTSPAALTSVTPVVGEPGRRSKKVRTTKNARPPARFRNATATNATPTSAATASVGDRPAATPIATPARTTPEANPSHVDPVPPTV